MGLALFMLKRCSPSVERAVSVERLYALLYHKAAYIYSLEKDIGINFIE